LRSEEGRSKSATLGRLRGTGETPHLPERPTDDDDDDVTPFPHPTGSALTPGPSDDPEAVAFLQQRVSSFARIAGSLGGGFLAFRIVVAAFDKTGESLRDSAFVGSIAFHALGVLPLLTAGVLTQRRAFGARTLRWIEGLATYASSAAYQLMATTIPAPFRPDLIVLLALTAGFVSRAVYVPSKARVTLFLGAALAPSLLFAVWAAYRGFTPPEGFYEMSGDQVRLMALFETGAWWAVTVTIATLTSRTLYGLRKEASALRRLGQYTLDAELGEGGMGRVYRAHHAMLKRPTAVKVLLPERAGAQGVARFEREVQLTARLSHPHTVTVYDYGRTPEGRFYYAMELLEGATLGEIVDASGPQPPARVVPILDAVAGSLAEAHAIGLIHRDIKPANIMLSRRAGVRDFPKVLDFGLVKELPQEGEAPEAGLTQRGVLAGTPLYMAPEAIADPEHLDGRSDLYALGAVAYYLLTGTHVFLGKTSVEVCAHHLHQTPEPLHERLGAPVPAALAELVLRCLAKTPGDRPESAVAFQRALRQAAIDDRIPTWTEDDADRWWDAQEGRIAAIRAGRPEGGRTAARTLEVALAG